MKNRVKKKRASRAKRAERWEYVHARGCAELTCATKLACEEILNSIHEAAATTSNVEVEKLTSEDYEFLSTLEEENNE